MAVFDEKADTYDAWYETPIGAFADRVETECAFELFAFEDDMHVLDVGCGTGNFSIKLAERGCLVTAIDVSEEMLAAAREKAAERRLDIDFRRMDVYELGFPADHFDAMLSMTAIEFIHERERAVDELFRVVKEGGQLLIGTINRESAWGRMYLDRAATREDSIFKHAELMTLAELTALKPEQLCTTGRALYLPPDTPPEDISMERERELSTSEQPGFICALWVKQA